MFIVVPIADVNQVSTTLPSLMGALRPTTSSGDAALPVPLDAQQYTPPAGMHTNAKRCKLAELMRDCRADSCVGAAHTGLKPAAHSNFDVRRHATQPRTSMPPNTPRQGQQMRSRHHRLRHGSQCRMSTQQWRRQCRCMVTNRQHGEDAMLRSVQQLGTRQRFSHRKALAPPRCLVPSLMRCRNLQCHPTCALNVSGGSS
jgi:hypothetical protein